MAEGDSSEVISVNPLKYLSQIKVNNVGECHDIIDTIMAI